MQRRKFLFNLTSCAGVGPPCSVQHFRKRNILEVFYAWDFPHSFSRWATFLVFLQRAAFISSGLLLLNLPQTQRFWIVLPFPLVSCLRLNLRQSLWSRYRRWALSCHGVVHGTFFCLSMIFIYLETWWKESWIKMPLTAFLWGINE